jgi:hypothetical protein
MWTLSNLRTNTTKTLEEWGIRKPVLNRVSLDIDTLTFEITTEFDADEAISLDDTVTLIREGTPYFTGRVDQTPRTATGQHESAAYVVVGPWWDVRDLTFQSEWRVLANPLDPEAGLVTQRRSHVILNMDIFGRSIYTTKAQIFSALEYVLIAADDTGRERPFQLDFANIDIPEFRPWLDEVVDLKCSEIIQRQLRWTPDVVSWFDYSTSPPTIHIKQRSSLPAATVQFGVAPLSEIQLKARPDLQVSEVCLKYEQVNVVNGVGYFNLVIDAWPIGATGQKRRAICQTITLQGSEVSYSLADIVCEPILESDAAWWIGQHAPLADPNVDGLTIIDGSAVRETSLPRYLVSGNITGWMLARNRATAARETIRAKANWLVTDGPTSDTVLQDNKEKNIHTELVATNLTTGIYLSALSETPGDPIPINVAQFVYNATSFLHYDGQLLISEDECSGSVTVGNVVNVTGALDAYASMRAIVQAVSEDIESGRTSITLGPPKHLGLDDLIEFLRGNRNRQRYTPTSAMTDGQSFTAAPVDIGQETPLKNTNADNGKLDKFTVASKFIIDTADLPPFSDAFPYNYGQIRCRETQVCVTMPDGTKKTGYAFVPRSEVYFKP